MQPPKQFPKFPEPERFGRERKWKRSAITNWQRACAGLPPGAPLNDDRYMGVKAVCADMAITKRTLDRWVMR
jgi:hypothetical protein